MTRVKKGSANVVLVLSKGQPGWLRKRSRADCPRGPHLPLSKLRIGPPRRKRSPLEEGMSHLETGS